MKNLVLFRSKALREPDIQMENVGAERRYLTFEITSCINELNAPAIMLKSELKC
jgi:hypothetical protein